jgi:hypothetical protein
MKKKTFHILTLCFLLACTLGILMANQVVAVFAIDNIVQEINVVDSGAETIRHILITMVVRTYLTI